MYVFSTKANRGGTISRNRKLAESYRDPKTGKPRKRVVQNIEKLPRLERARILYRYGGLKHMDNDEWVALVEAGDFHVPSVEGKVGDAYSGAGTAVLRHYAYNTGLKTLLTDQLGHKDSQLILDMIYQQIVHPDSKLSYAQRRPYSLSYLLEGKETVSEDSLYRAMDNLEEGFSQIRNGLNQNTSQPTRLLYYDLSNSYFTGMKAELGGYGDSKEKRYDRYIVSYGLVVNQNHIPLDIAVWKGGTADTNTVRETFRHWQENYQGEEAIWIADSAMSSEQNLEDIQSFGLSYITGMPSNTQVSVLNKLYEHSPGLFDQHISEYIWNNQRYVLCRHDSKGYYREYQNKKHRRKVYESLLHIQKTPQNKNQNKLYHRVMKVLEKHEQTDCWHFELNPYQDNKGGTHYKLEFQLLREQAHTKDILGHYYLLQTDLNTRQMEKEDVKASYKSLIHVEHQFRNLKTHMDIRPIRHWRAPRIKAHIYLNFLALWLLKHIENSWKDSNIHSEVAPQLAWWDEQLKLNEVLDSNDQVIALQWNKGTKAKQIIEEIKQFGEYEHIKPDL